MGGKKRMILRHISAKIKVKDSRLWERLVLLSVSITVLVLMIITVITIISWLLVDYTKHKSHNGLQGIAYQESESSCLVQGTQENGGYCLHPGRPFKGGNWMWDVMLCVNLEKIFGYSSIVDFGAGLGYYGRCFLRHTYVPMNSGNKLNSYSANTSFKSEMKSANLTNKPQVVKSWTGYDGASRIEDISNGFVEYLDLSLSNIDLGNRFDWVLSVEVGEHIPKKYMDNYIDNIVKHACIGIVLSWAVPGQGGYNHVNERSNEDVVRDLEKRGLIHDLHIEKQLRMGSYLTWLRNTIMVFKVKPLKDNSCFTDVKL